MLNSLSFLKRIIYKLFAIFAIFFGIDNLIARASIGSFSWLKQFIPKNYRYKAETRKTIKRRGIKYEINPFEVVDWEIFSNCNDLLIESAFPLLQKKKQLTVFDVGANCGRFSLGMQKKMKNADRLCEVYAFEPNPSVYKKLVHNLDLNKEISSGIQPVNIGAGDENKTLELQAPLRNRGAGSLVRNYEGEPLENFKIEIIKIDDFIEKQNISCLDLMKIDVEGYEPRTLIGAEMVINKFSSIILLEIVLKNSEDNGFAPDFIFHFLKNKSYFLYRIDEDKKMLTNLIAVEDFLACPFFNMVCVKKEIIDKKIIV